MVKPIYLDYNGTTPHDPEVIEAIRPFLEGAFGNPSSAHWYGIQPKKAVETARRQVAGMLNCSAGEIIFTSGGTESNNHAIRGMARWLQDKGNHIITSSFEHPAVFEVCGYLARNGFEITYLPVGEEGLVDPADVAKAIRPSTILISIMHANNEVGTVQPLKAISHIARKQGIALHTDAAQSVGKIPADVRQLGVDLLSIAGQKVYAPKGVQETGRRAGTENIMGIVGLGKACELAQRDLEKNMAHMKFLRDRLHQGLLGRLADIRLNGHPEQRLPNTLSLSFKDLEANRILEEIGLEVAASAGAACHADTVELSHVLIAMGLPAEIDKAIRVVADAVARLKPV
ncbi:MAG: cysteine desulfurase [Deltaproteobacteria bacterium]|nr:cysteine desulfurase [Deltaproteobacteria bacterium]